ncbi:endonuclease III [Erysipelothrix rhusiopathiae]|uniref:Endonuclease III n=1 Tax=Erysipelothrix rhusiopathiae ATCC 19414 TaxID=525280 RepID=E7FUJ3_ERYRH|nr:endonuclease III [Erysipelothrix rhusiopathiae]EFY09398.1 endonuclease III [Erysipelothrix rhusiopathiae ATCC 19414]MDE8038795.1 endonuclease III [Erysipelothrix rhusiopathiae]MDE8040977.1 endonuclease III [Erysipelothrix rhusiopathiae]MDE8042618.1 endonuclease III [Erysipelothrix rhusiopathiae]MDE8050324.1 endonuclease III [Erysipelothrix rhusiopathiae]
MTVAEIIEILDAEFPNAKSDLNYRNPFELLIAVTLSAQTTDVAVNKVTPALFERYPTPYSLSQADVKDVESYLKTIGLYRNKAKYIVACASMLVDDFEGEVPRTRTQLMKLPGVGRKTANVVLAEGFKLPAIAVDTHVERVAKRLKLAKPNDTVEDVERKLMRKIPREDWARAHHLLLLFGRYHSTARNERDAFELLEELKEKHQR